MSRGFNPRHARQSETWVSLCNLMLKRVAFRSAPLFLSRIVPGVKIAKGLTPFVPRFDLTVNFSIA